MKTYPLEYRQRVIALTDKGKSAVAIAEVLGVSASWVRSIKRLNQAGRPIEPKSRANRRRSLAQREGERIRMRIADHPGTTLEDLKRDLKLDVSIANLWYALQELGLSLKKKHFTPANKTGPTWSSNGRLGKSCKRASTRAGSFFSTKPSAPPR